MAFPAEQGPNPDPDRLSDRPRLVLRRFDDESEHSGGSSITYGEFLERYFIPHLLAQSPPPSPATIDTHWSAARRWSEAFGAALPLDQVTAQTGEQFLAYIRSRKNHAGQDLSTWTVAKIRNLVQDVLHYAGLPGQHRDDGPTQRGFFGEDAAGNPRPAPRLPRAKRIEKPVKACFSPGQMVALIEACRHASQPGLSVLSAAVWWTALFRFLFWTGLRIDSAIHAEWSWIQRSKDLVWLAIPGRFFKGGRPENVWLAPPAMAALESLRAEGGAQIFPWVHSPKHLHKLRRDLLKRAGLLPLPEFGFHAFRRAISDQLYEIDPDLPGLLLRHRRGMSERHYVSAEKIIAGQAKKLRGPMARLAKRLPVMLTGSAPNE